MMHEYSRSKIQHSITKVGGIVGRLSLVVGLEKRKGRKGQKRIASFRSDFNVNSYNRGNGSREIKVNESSRTMLLEGGTK